MRRLPADYLAACGRPAVAVETFTDPARGTGTAYAAAGFTPGRADRRRVRPRPRPGCLRVPRPQGRGKRHPLETILG